MNKEDLYFKISEEGSLFQMFGYISAMRDHQTLKKLSKNVEELLNKYCSERKNDKR